MIKGKRTKRQRPLIGLTTCGSSSSSGDMGIISDCITSSTAVSSPTRAEEDMANCLILLAQGQLSQNQKPSSKLYQCKTCDRCFVSFQALGGHRASHKRPKSSSEPAIEKKKKMMVPMDQEHEFARTTLSLQVSSAFISSDNINKSTRVHECSICGAEFSSGQALGGHMRRHRTLMAAANAHESDHESKKPRNLHSLDLNLPAPEDDDRHHRESKFPFALKEQVIVFSASALVDC